MAPRSGTFPVSLEYFQSRMLYDHPPRDDNPSSARDPSEQLTLRPLFPFSDVPVYADTVDLESLGFHDFWGCLLTPENVAARICTDDLRYHVWVAAKRVVESGLIQLSDKEALVRATTDQFMLELGLVLLDLCPGPLLLFLDPRLHGDWERMVASAMALVAKFDQADVRRWRVVVTLPATEDGLRAARVLTRQHGVHTHLALVSSLAHAAACIETGAGTVSMSVAAIMEWFERRQGIHAGHVSPDHPGIEAIQACATYIHRHRINVTLLTTDVRRWSELNALGGIGATALDQTQLDQIPMRRLATWYPSPDDGSAATERALRFEYPTRYLNDDGDGDGDSRGFWRSLPAASRSVATAVLYVRLARMADRMDAIERVVRREVKRRVRLETVPFECLYLRPSSTSRSDARVEEAVE